MYFDEKINIMIGLQYAIRKKKSSWKFWITFEWITSVPLPSLVDNFSVIEIQNFLIEAITYCLAKLASG